MVINGKVINGYGTTADWFLKNYVLNYVSLSPVGKTMLKGATSVEVSGNEILIRQGSHVVYTFGYKIHNKSRYYELDCSDENEIYGFELLEKSA